MTLCPGQIHFLLLHLELNPSINTVFPVSETNFVLICYLHSLEVELSACQWAQVAGFDSAWISGKKLCLVPGFSNWGLSHAQQDRDQEKSKGTPGANMAAVTEAERLESTGWHLQEPRRVCLLTWTPQMSGLPSPDPDTPEPTIKERKYTRGV